MYDDLSPETFRPAIRAAGRQVGGARTELEDVARIMARAAYSAQAHHRVEAAIAATIPPAAYDQARVASLERGLSDLAAAGYSAGELQRHPGLGAAVVGAYSTLPTDDLSRRLPRGGCWAEVAEILSELDAAHVEVNRRAAQIEAEVERWYAEHADALWEIALEEARVLLDSWPFRLRQWLVARGPGITRGVRWLVSEYGCSEAAVWKWLSGERPLPGWLVRELKRS